MIKTILPYGTRVRLRWQGDDPRKLRTMPGGWTWRVIWANDVEAYVARLEKAGRHSFEWRKIGSDEQWWQI